MNTSELAKKLIAGDRRALARAITLVESGRADHRAQAHQLLDAVRATGTQALRIGMSGTPGVGKSTYIEEFGMMLCERGKRVAVLAVDPSSAISGGSILGDKTRMPRLARAPNAFIRPSPTLTQLGGVARRSRDAVSLCEAAGYDVVLIETVGVGQSETMVAEMSDLFVLLLAPVGGDALQGIKRGIMEIADLILVNKADGELHAAAARTCADYTGALGLLRRRASDPPDFPKAMLVSALTGHGLQAAWDQMLVLADWRKTNGHWHVRRAAQARHWFEQSVRHELLAQLSDAGVQARLAALGEQVTRGALSESAAVQALLDSLNRRGRLA